ncbi:hypothetical protein M413DRAFT_281256 [Hebeloma cylindrosporum]|uniref:Uncharacterized protein n=1 Tax=Hebeloma cylindrosporum TaxID=76867 RepID=A0A0C2XGR2_HEBCY|nr:hypothetical protein M413DRAFT_281256 [Hebeloma cylindrosporum h7]
MSTFNVLFSVEGLPLYLSLSCNSFFLAWASDNVNCAFSWASSTPGLEVFPALSRELTKSIQGVVDCCRGFLNPSLAFFYYLRSREPII